MPIILSLLLLFPIVFPFSYAYYWNVIMEEVANVIIQTPHQQGQHPDHVPLSPFAVRIDIIAGQRREVRLLRHIRRVRDIY